MSQNRAVFVCLYIPIWLYSNIKNTNLSLYIVNFTFQSGYIPTGVLEEITVDIVHFTFQSGYIPTSE